MVYTFGIGFFTSGWYHQRNRLAIFEYPCWLQYVFHIFCVDNWPNRSSPAWLFELAGGAIPDYEDTCIPKSQREASFTIAALHQWEMEIDDDRCKESAEEVCGG